MPVRMHEIAAVLLRLTAAVPRRQVRALQGIPSSSFWLENRRMYELQNTSCPSIVILHSRPCTMLQCSAALQHYICIIIIIIITIIDIVMYYCNMQSGRTPTVQHWRQSTQMHHALLTPASPHASADCSPPCSVSTAWPSVPCPCICSRCRQLQDACQAAFFYPQHSSCSDCKIASG